MRKLPVVPICRRASRLPRRANHNDASAHPVSARGAFGQSSPNARRGAVDAGGVGANRQSQGGSHRERWQFARNDHADPAYGKIAWSWRPKLAPSPAVVRSAQPGQPHQRSAGRRWQQSSSHRGDRGISRQTIRAGKAGMSRLPPGFSCAFERKPAAQEVMGASRRPVFPAPSLDEGEWTSRARAPTGRENATLCPT